jgi:hypothetical protein
VIEAQDDAKRAAKPAKAQPGIITVALPPMSSAFDTASWLVAA